MWSQRFTVQLVQTHSTDLGWQPSHLSALHTQNTSAAAGIPFQSRPHLHAQLCLAVKLRRIAGTNVCRNTRYQKEIVMQFKHR